MSQINLETYEVIGRVLTMGTICGHSINIAHELGHRGRKFEQNLAKILLLGSLYMHFIIEHNRGHHKRVATRTKICLLFIATIILIAKYLTGRD